MNQPLADAYPLAWPIGRKRAPYPERSNFGLSFARARDELLRNLKLLGARDVVISSNLRLRIDGLPLAGQAQPKDAGIAVYFRHKSKSMCFACDRWAKVEDNVRAIALTIEALRGIARWGTGDMLEAAFTGFTALPAPGATRSWREVLEFAPEGRPPAPAIENNYRRLRSKHHPDNGGNADEFHAVQVAYEQAHRELGLS